MATELTGREAGLVARARELGGFITFGGVAGGDEAAAMDRLVEAGVFVWVDQPGQVQYYALVDDGEAL
jgi:hypothetical protein